VKTAKRRIQVYKDIECAPRNNQAFRQGVIRDQARQWVNRLGLDFSKVPTVIHVTGSYAKGTTALLLGQVLGFLGFNTAIYNKPHLVEPSERVIINGKRISYKDYRNALEYVLSVWYEFNNVPPDCLTLFFVAGLWYIFSKELDIDVLIVEAGLGIKWDYTQLVSDLVKNYYVVITGIHKNHTTNIGKSLQEIFDNKNFNLDKTQKTFLLEPSKGYKIKEQNKFVVVKDNLDVRVKNNGLFGASLWFKGLKQPVYTNLKTKYHQDLLIKILNIVDWVFDMDIKKQLTKQEQVKTMFFDLPARFMPFYYKPNRTHWIVDNAHSKEQLCILRKALDKSFDQTFKAYGKRFLLNRFLLRSKGKFLVRVFLLVGKQEWLRAFNKCFLRKAGAKRGLLYAKALASPTDWKNKTKLKQQIFNTIKNAKPQDLNLFTGSVYSTGHFLKQTNYVVFGNKIKTFSQTKYHSKHLIRFVSTKIRKNITQNHFNKILLQLWFNNKFGRFYNRYLKEYADAFVIFKPIKHEPNLAKMLAKADKNWKQVKVFTPNISAQISLFANKNSLTLPLQNKHKITVYPVYNKSHKKWQVLAISQSKPKKYTNFLELQQHVGTQFVIFLPGLIFDNFGNRIGYGGGTYDRLFTGLSYIFVDIWQTPINTVLITPAKETKKHKISKLVNLTILGQVIVDTRNNMHIRVQGNKVLDLIKQKALGLPVVVPIRYPWEKVEFLIDEVKT